MANRQPGRRAPEGCDEGNDAGPGRCGDGDVQQHEIPGQMQPVLQLAQADLHEQNREHGQRGDEQPRRPRSPGRQIAEQEQERAAEDRHDPRMSVENRF